jgi:hypothetical protein
MAGTQSGIQTEPWKKSESRCKRIFPRLRRDLDLGAGTSFSPSESIDLDGSALDLCLDSYCLAYPRAKERSLFTRANPEKIKGRSNKTRSKLWKAAWSSSKPLIAAYLEIIHGKIDLSSSRLYSLLVFCYTKTQRA